MDENKVKFCPNCGMKNDESDMFCGNCGTKLEVRVMQPAYRPNLNDSAKASVNTGAAFADNSNMNSSNNSAFQTNNSTTQNYNAGVSQQSGEAGKSHATASLVLGIIAVVCWFFGYSAIISVACGFIGITLAGKAKEEGFEGGTRTAGFVLSLIGLIGGGLVLIACVACVGSMGMLGASMYR